MNSTGGPASLLNPPYHPPPPSSHDYLVQQQSERPSICSADPNVQIGGLSSSDENGFSTGGLNLHEPLEHDRSGSSASTEDVKPTGGGKKGTKRNKSGGGGGGGESARGGAGETTLEGGVDVKFDKDGNPKKKRKQLVACDSCRLRRVKCDRAEKMGGPCSECAKKKITCTDTYVKNKPKTIRSGKLIQQAKALYGDDPTKPAPPPSKTAAETIPTSRSASRPSVTEYTTPRPPSRQDLVQIPPPSSSSSQTRLIQSQITRDISSELVSTFFSVLHQICPLVDRDQFEIAWNLAGQVPENLTPANECLAAVLQAWASRISDNPLIVGFGVPTLEDIRSGGGGGGGRDLGDLTLVGNRREEFARAMRDRALRLVDERGLLRISSAAACSALTLLEFLITFDDTSRVKTRGRYLMVGACEHLRNLNAGQCDDITEPLIPPEQLSGGTLLWMVYTRDALVAMMGGRTSCFTEDELTSLCDLFTNPITADVLPYISSHDARMLSGLAVASMFRHVVACVRSTITLLTCPLARRSRLQESNLQQIWSEIDDSSRFTSIFRQSVDAADFGDDSGAKTHVWFRDLIGIKGQHILGIHVHICQRLDEEEARAAKTGGPNSDEDGSSETYLDMLRRVKDQSDERFLQVAREWTAMIRTYGSDILFSAFFTVEYTRDYLHHMVECPSWEQGGPANYTWSNKIDECEALMSIMQIDGWVWAGFDRNILQCRHSLARQNQRIQERLAQQQRHRHSSYPQEPSYHSAPTNAFGPSDQTSTLSWPAHSHAHTISHPPTTNPVPLPQPDYITTVSIPAPSLPTYYESNASELSLNTYGQPTSYPSSSATTDTNNTPPLTSLPPQPNGLTTYTSPPIYQPASTSSSSTNPSYYHYEQPLQNGTSFQMNGTNGIIGGGGGGGYGETHSTGGGNEEIQRLPPMSYAASTENGQM